jgi:SAM-dependent methyltransferase
MIARVSWETVMPEAGSPREYGSWLDGHAGVFVPGERVLELGCGLGDDAAEMTARGLRVVALDLSFGRVAQAARNAPAASFVTADLTRGLPFRDSTFDLVVASLSLHYFDRRTTGFVISDIARVLREDGIILCRTNMVGERIALWGQGVECEPDFFEVEPGRFKRFFSEESLRETLATDFTVEMTGVERTVMSGGLDKQTVVARARRNSE